MASKAPTINPICPICLESFQVVKMLSVFCQRCISSRLTKSIAENEVIPCPTCRIESPLPENGIDGLVDFTGDGADKDSHELLGAVGDSGYFHEEAAAPKVMKDNEHCLGCKFKPKSRTVRAENLCEDCGRLPMCRDCTKVHSRNKATQDHVVTSLKYKKSNKKGTCESHDQMMSIYCYTCARHVCRLCVMFEHGDHVIKKIDCETFRELVTDVAAIRKEKEKKMDALRQMVTDLQEIKSTALGEKDTLAKAIEDHVEKCIGEMLNQKKTLNAKLNAEYKVIEDVTTCLGRIPDVRQKLEDAIMQAKRMENDLHPSDIEKIVRTRKSLVEAGKLVNQIDTGVYLKDYQLVQQEKPRFEPNTIDFTIGHLVHKTPHLQPAASTGATHQQESKEKLRGAIDVVNVNKTVPVGKFQAVVDVKPSPRDIRQCRLLFETTYDFVKCVANLGERFAVVSKSVGDLLYRVGIYDFSGQHKHTIPDTYGDCVVQQIASTPHGNLVVLSKMGYLYPVMIFLFDSTGKFISTTTLDSSQSFSVGSFDVTARNEYVILDVNAPETVRMFRQDGSILLSQEVKEWSQRIASASKFVFACRGPDSIDAYELKENQLVYITSSEPFECVWGISATSNGRVTVMCERNGHCCFGRSLMSSVGFSEWSFEEIEQCRGGEGNISVRGKHVVTCNNGTVRVFSYE